MAEETKIEQTRRNAIKTAAQVAVTAPAVGLLLSAGTKSAAARIHYGDDSHITVTNSSDNNGIDDPVIINRSGPTGDDYFTF